MKIAQKNVYRPQPAIATTVVAFFVVVEKLDLCQSYFQLPSFDLFFLQIEKALVFFMRSRMERKLFTKTDDNNVMYPGLTIETAFMENRNVISTPNTGTQLRQKNTVLMYDPEKVQQLEVRRFLKVMKVQTFIVQVSEQNCISESFVELDKE